MPRHRSPFVPTGASWQGPSAQALGPGRAERPHTRPAATQRPPGIQAKPFQILPNLPVVDSGAPPGALIGVKRLCPRVEHGHGGQQRGKGKAERAVSSSQRSSHQARAPKATAAPRRAATGRARARPAEGGPDRPETGRTGGAQRPRGGPAGRGGRSPSSERGRAGTTKTQPPQRRRPPISAPRPIFGRFRLLSSSFPFFRLFRLIRSLVVPVPLAAADLRLSLLPGHFL